MGNERSQTESSNQAASPSTGASLVFVTHPKRGALAFAERVVDEHLAACVNLVRTTSVYRWEGARERSEEVLLVIKTAVERVEALEAFVKGQHPYDTPEFVVLAPQSVGPEYLVWLLENSAEPER